jgi:hypothetical protein
MSKIITVKQCIEIMDSGSTFSCLVVTYDRSRRKGGKPLEIPQARIDRPQSEIRNPQSEIAPRPMTDYEAKRFALENPLEGAGGGRNPNHQKWYTRNVRPLADGHPLTDLVKIHPPLLLEFNGMEVVP